MLLSFLKSKWEVPDLSLDAFFERVAADGFDGAELFLPALTEDPETVAALQARHGLQAAIAIVTEGATPEDHMRELESGVARSARYAPVAINVHAGRDLFAFEDNVRILARTVELAGEYGVPVVVETHRRRPTYSAVETRRFLDAIPGLALTLDVSHWMVVHESDLADQAETLSLAVRRTRYVHARVGYEEGPQVSDPRAPEFAAHVRRHVDIWRSVIEHCRRQRVPRLCITPEFGPAPYQQTLPYTRQPVADVWELNVAMRDILVRELA